MPPGTRPGMGQPTARAVERAQLAAIRVALARGVPVTDAVTLRQYVDAARVLVGVTGGPTGPAEALLGAEAVRLVRRVAVRRRDA